MVEGGEVDAIRSFPGKSTPPSGRNWLSGFPANCRKYWSRSDLVAEGQVLARLDPADYALVLEDRQAKSTIPRATSSGPPGTGGRRQYLAA